MKTLLRLALLLLLPAMHLPAAGRTLVHRIKGELPFIYSPSVVFATDADHTMVYRR